MDAIPDLNWVSDKNLLKALFSRIDKFCDQTENGINKNKAKPYLFMVSYIASKIRSLSMKDVNASIITIGDELLIGQTIDTNSAFIARELYNIGIWVKSRIAVGDDKQVIIDAMNLF